MFAPTRITRIVRPTRCFATSSFQRSENKPVEKKPNQDIQEVRPYGLPEDAVAFPGVPKAKVSWYHRYCLVWAGCYKTTKDVPPAVEHHQMDRALNIGRIYAVCAMIVLAIPAYLIAIRQVKQSVREGRKGYHELLLERQEQMLAEHRKNQEAKKNAEVEAKASAK